MGIDRIAGFALDPQYRGFGSMRLRSNRHHGTPGPSAGMRPPSLRQSPRKPAWPTLGRNCPDRSGASSGVGRSLRSCSPGRPRSVEGAARRSRRLLRKISPLGTRATFRQSREGREIEGLRKITPLGTRATADDLVHLSREVARCRMVPPGPPREVTRKSHHHRQVRLHDRPFPPCRMEVAAS